MVLDNTRKKIGDVTSRISRAVRLQTSLKSFVRQVRDAKTAAAERVIVERECANIRESIRLGDPAHRARDVAKLLFVFMLGYPAHFGMLECTKLISSPKFAQKRIGYLAVMLMLDEKKDAQILIINSLKNDLNSLTHHTVGLALCTIGSVCSSEVTMALAGDVVKLLSSPVMSTRKKATLAAYRMIQKEPEFAGTFLDGAEVILEERVHETLPPLLSLLILMCEKNEDAKDRIRKKLDILIDIEKDLLKNVTSFDHRVGGVCDPFLQVKILRLLRILGSADAEASETMSEILTEVATVIDPSENAGSAVILELVLTIMGTQSESGLRCLSTNILSRFLISAEKNMRYIALQTLHHVAETDVDSVRPQQGAILECLLDLDTSIQKKAMELAFAITDETNIELVGTNIISFLQRAPPEFRAYCSAEMYIAAERFSPSDKWHLDTMISVLKLAENEVPEEVVRRMIQFVSEKSALQRYAVRHLLRAGQEKARSAQPLLQIAAWCIGEYGELLLQHQDDGQELVKETEVLKLLEKVLFDTPATLLTKQYVVTALAKLNTRFKDTQHELRGVITFLSCQMNLELQQRSVEYRELLQKEHLRQNILARMPVINRKTMRYAARPIANAPSRDEAEESGGLDLLEFSSSSLLFLPGPGEREESKSGKDLLSELDLSGPQDVNKTSPPILKDLPSIFLKDGDLSYLESCGVSEANRNQNLDLKPIPKTLSQVKSEPKMAKSTSLQDIENELKLQMTRARHRPPC